MKIYAPHWKKLNCKHSTKLLSKNKNLEMYLTYFYKTKQKS